MQFKNKIAIVTGAGNGIGRGASLMLGEEGATVVVADLNEERAKKVSDEITNSGGKATYFKLDVTKSNEITKMSEYIKENFGLIDILINNAGISIITPFFEHTEDIWDKTMEVNLKGQFLCCKAIIPQMLEKGAGSIINMSSQSGKIGTNDYQAYCASKFGVIGLTQSLSKEFAGKGVRVNSVCPGVVYTSMWEKQKTDYATKKNIDPEGVMDYFADKIPKGRVGKVDDVTNMISFLLSDKADYITGQAINVNGGDLMF